MLDITDDFPLLKRTIEDERVIYLDSAATSLKPTAVIDAVQRFYTHSTANVHRAIHQLADEATDAFELARADVARLIGAEQNEIILTRGTTDGISLIRNGARSLEKVVTTAIEHHSNYLPWAFGDSPRVVGLVDEGRLDLDQLAGFLKEGVDLVAVGYVSNVHGLINPIEEIIAMAHDAGARVLVDAAQAVGHFPIDVKALDVDFMAFSSHKMMGPGGVGALYCKRDALALLQPVVLGGHTVESVHLESYELQPAPARFEAGTPPIEAVIGWGAAARYLSRLGLENVEAHCKELVRYAYEKAQGFSNIRLVGPAEPDSVSATLSFVVEDIEAHGVARMLSNRSNLCLRSGFHCAQPLHETLGLPPTVRASFHAYNTKADIDVLIDALDAVLALT
ncbi:MAG: cysteine desulfurase [Pseudomonadota bacterium]